MKATCSYQGWPTAKDVLQARSNQVSPDQECWIEILSKRPEGSFALNVAISRVLDESKTYPGSRKSKNHMDMAFTLFAAAF
jgi:hypothetical protein